MATYSEGSPELANMTIGGRYRTLNAGCEVAAIAGYGAGSGDLPARWLRCLRTAPADVHECAVRLVARDSLGAGFLGLIGEVWVEPANLSCAEVAVNVEKIVNARPEGEAWICPEPLQYDPGVAPLVQREFDTDGNDSGPDASGWIAFAE